MGSSDQHLTATSSPCPSSSSSLLPSSWWLLLPPTPRPSAPWMPSLPALVRLALPGTPAGMLETSWAASREFLEPLTAGTVPVMFSPGWDSWTARWAHQNNLFDDNNYE